MSVSMRLFLCLFLIGCALFGPMSLAAAKAPSDELALARGALEDGLYGIARSRLDLYIRRGPEVENYGEALLLRGQAHFFLGNTGVAQSDFKRLLDDVPEGTWTPEANYWLAECAYTQADFDTAIHYYEIVSRRFPKSRVHPLALFGLGWSYYDLGKDSEAVDVFKRIIKEYSRHEIFGEAQFKFAECQYRMGRLDEAGYAFRQFLKKQKKSPSAPLAHLWLGEINYEMERYDTARESYRTAIEQAEAMLQSRPEWIGKAYYGSAWAAYQQDDHAAALTDIDRFLEYHARDHRLDSALFLRGLVLTKLDRNLEAIAAYEKLIRRFPKGDWVRRATLHKAALQFEDGKPEMAIISLLQMERDGTVDALTHRAWHLMGKIHFQMGRQDQATQWLTKLTDSESADPNVTVPARILLGDAWAHLGDDQKALEIYDEVLSRHPQHAEAPLAQYRVGEVLYGLRKYDSAIAAFRSLAVNFSQSSFQDRAQYKIGWCYFHLGDFTTAGKYFDRVVQEYPDSGLVFDARLMGAESVYNEGRFKDALSRFRKLKSENKGGVWEPQLDYGVAWAAWQHGDTGEAVKAFKSLVDEHPQNPLVADALLWLGQYYAQNEDWKTAQRFYADIPMRFPQHELVDDSLYWSGWAFYRGGDELSAMERFKTLAAHHRQSPLAGDALYHTAKILVEQKKFKSALEYYSRALEQAPVKLRPEIQYHLARCYQDIDDSSQAILEYLKVTYLYPEATEWTAKAHLQVGWLFEREKRWKEARKIYEKIADAEGEEATVAKQRLASIEENTVTE